MQDAVCNSFGGAAAGQLCDCSTINITDCPPHGRDNLEFVQWVKRFWDQHFASDSYDAVARRKGAAVEIATIAPINRPTPVSQAAVGRGAGRRTPSGSM
jgi:hypothetical protein